LSFRFSLHGFLHTEVVMIRNFFSFVFGLLGKAILLAMVLVLSGMLYVGAYFYQKSGEPMTKAEAHRYALGSPFGTSGPAGRRSGGFTMRRQEFLRSIQIQMQAKS
jgi:hypothetical protein